MPVRKAIIISACLTLAHTPVFAKEPGSGPNPFSDCGIGAALFPSTKWAAVTSNVIWDVGSTALTSATSSPETCNGKQVAAALFINDTYEKLVEETARAEGEHLSALLNIFECDSARAKRTIEATREGMANVVSRTGYATQDRTQKAAEYYEVVESAVVTTCSA